MSIRPTPERGNPARRCPAFSGARVPACGEILDAASLVPQRRSGGAASNLSPFNPMTDTPRECPERSATNPSACAVAGYNWLRGPRFGQATGTASYYTGTPPVTSGQLPRTYAFTAGFRF